MNLSSSSSLSSLRSSGNYHSSCRLARIDEQGGNGGGGINHKYDKYRLQQTLEEQQRKVYLGLCVLFLFLFGVYQFTAYFGANHNHNHSTISSTSHSGSNNNNNNNMGGERVLDKNDDYALLQSLRRTRDRRSTVGDEDGARARGIPKEDHSHGGLYHQHHDLLHQQQQQQHVGDEQPILLEDKLVKEKNGRGGRMMHKVLSKEERLNQAIRELQQYQADAEGRQQEYQDELKAQLQEELRHMT